MGVGVGVYECVCVRARARACVRACVRVFVCGVCVVLSRSHVRAQSHPGPDRKRFNVIYVR